MRIINLTKPKNDKTMKNFNLLPYVSIYWLGDKKTLAVGWFNICIAFGFEGIVNEVEEMKDEYYLQDNRCYIGNDILFWAKDGKGYTTDTSKAQVYTRKQAYEQHESRGTDIPWLKSYINERTRPSVDMQYCDLQICRNLEVKK